MALETFRDRLRRGTAEDITRTTDYSKREAEVLRLWMLGEDTQEIATELGVEQATVRSFKNKIRNKADEAKSTIGYAMAAGIWEPSDVEIDFAASHIDTIDDDLDPERVAENAKEIFEYEERTIQQLNEQRDRLKRMIEQRRETVTELRRQLHHADVIDANEWDTTTEKKRMELVVEVVEELQQFTDGYGVEKQDVLDELNARFDADPDTVEPVIQKLKQVGKLYEPQQMKLETTV